MKEKTKDFKIMVNRNKRFKTQKRLKGGGLSKGKIAAAVLAGVAAAAGAGYVGYKGYKGYKNKTKKSSLAQGTSTKAIPIFPLTQSKPQIKSGTLAIESKIANPPLAEKKILREKKIKYPPAEPKPKMGLVDRQKNPTSYYKELDEKYGIYEGDPVLPFEPFNLNQITTIREGQKNIYRKPHKRSHGRKKKKTSKSASTAFTIADPFTNNQSDSNFDVIKILTNSTPIKTFPEFPPALEYEGQKPKTWTPQAAPQGLYGTLVNALLLSNPSYAPVTSKNLT